MSERTETKFLAGYVESLKNSTPICIVLRNKRGKFIYFLNLEEAQEFKEQFDEAFSIASGGAIARSLQENQYA